MRKLKLMADYLCYPLWYADRTDPHEVGDFAPDLLPLSESLREDLMAWAAEYDATLDMANPQEAGFDTQEDASKFKASGFELAKRLQDELGPQYEVITNIHAGPKPTATGPKSD
jgi:hypothetical protein